MPNADPVTPVDGISMARPADSRGPRANVVLLTLAAAVLLGALTGFVVAQREPDASATPSATAPTAAGAAAVIEPESVTSFDPAGGSGFRDDGNGTWSTQTYRTAHFGALKEGVGLLIDLGEPRGVTSVTLEQATPGLTVQLLAGDEPPSGSVEGMSSTDETTTADGETTLSGGDGGAHRYWIVWVSELAAAGDGFAATVSSPVVEGPAA